MVTPRWTVAALSAAIIVATVVTSAQRGAGGGEWRRYGADGGTTKYSPLDQIDKGNVSRLQIAWRRPASMPASWPKTRRSPTPTTSARARSWWVACCTAQMRSAWSKPFIQARVRRCGCRSRFPTQGPAGLRGTSARGVTYWAEGNVRRLFVVRGEYLIALDPATGKLATDFGDGGRIDLKAGLGPRATGYAWTGAPQICRDVIMVGVGIGASMSDRPMNKEGVPGIVQAFDVRTGKPRWGFNPIPRPGEVGSDTWENDSWSYSGDANMWSLISADESEGLAYLPLTSPTSDMYGGHRPGNNLFGNSLVCVRCADGTRVWHYQIVHHDLWDYDLPAAPILADITVDGKPIRAVVQLTKHAFAFVFDRLTGKPVWPIEERPVPASDVPGEHASRTQPFPTKPPPYDRQGLSSMDDLIDFTPELRAEAIAMLKNYRVGPLFTPPSIRGNDPNGRRGTIELPGSVGGADWQSGAFDPETGVLYVQSITTPFTADIVKPDPKQSNLDYVSGTRAWTPGPQGLPLFKPPYGRITAIDLNKGEQLWMTPNGDGPRDHPLLKPLNLPPLGSPGRSSPLVTKTLVFLGEGDPVMAGERPAPASRHAADHLTRLGREEVPRVRQSHRGDPLGNGTAGRRHGCADDVHVRGQAIRPRSDRQPGGSQRRVRRAQSAVSVPVI